MDKTISRDTVRRAFVLEAALTVVEQVKGKVDTVENWEKLARASVDAVVLAGKELVDSLTSDGVMKR